MVGKRKRDTSVVPRSTAAEEEGSPPANTDAAAHDVFRRYFEAQFQPLELPGGPVSQDTENKEEDDDNEDETEESDTGSEWGGISEEEDANNQVEVVEHKDSSVKTDDTTDKKARKAFMSGKVPSFSIDSTTNTTTTSKAEDGDDDDGTDADNLKNDLALQRLLRESHLLESASELAPTGKNRHKALDLRMQSLGANASIYSQHNMPSSIRRGIKSKATQKDDKRRREARENGIILEKPTPKSKANTGRRDRGVGGPSVGKFAGGTLNLSKRDLAAVEGSGRPSKGRRR
ncbi:hypothetical protein PHISP_00728 [Aspergillus sp. HF37]|nr:hypothetical protein PHISP_00728 [Aspergillus sp. HF37]